MNCDICGKDTEYFANIVLSSPDKVLSKEYKICEGCFMSFEYWKDSRKKEN
jgi:hypothetical protein